MCYIYAEHIPILFIFVTLSTCELWGWRLICNFIPAVFPFKKVAHNSSPTSIQRTHGHSTSSYLINFKNGIFRGVVCWMGIPKRHPSHKFLLSLSSKKNRHFFKKILLYIACYFFSFANTHVIPDKIIWRMK